MLPLPGVRSPYVTYTSSLITVLLAQAALAGTLRLQAILFAADYDALSLSYSVTELDRLAVVDQRFKGPVCALIQGCKARRPGDWLDRTGGHHALLPSLRAAWKREGYTSRGPGPPSRTARSPGPREIVTRRSRSASVPQKGKQSSSKPLVARKGSSPAFPSSKTRTRAVAPATVVSGQASDEDTEEEEDSDSKPPNLATVWALVVLSFAYLHHSTTG